MPSSLYVHTISVDRLSAGSGIQRVLTTVSSGVPCYIEPLDDETTVSINGKLGKTYRVWTDIQNQLKEGDKITDQDGQTFSVRGSHKYPNTGGVAHAQAVVELNG